MFMFLLLVNQVQEGNSLKSILLTFVIFVFNMLGSVYAAEAYFQAS